MAVADLEKQLWALRIGEADYVPFNPPQSNQRWPPGRMPRGLFRVFTPKSHGLTNSSWTSLWMQDTNPQTERWTSARTDRAQAAEMINRHIRWWAGADDNLVSWTSSLLFALVYMFHLRANIRDGSEFRNVFLDMLDTKEFPIVSSFGIWTLLPPSVRNLTGLQEFERLLRRQRREFSGYYYGNRRDYTGCRRVETIPASH